MERPSRLLLLFTAIGVATYAALQPPRADPSVVARAEKKPVVVRRSQAEPPAPKGMLAGRLLDRLGWPVGRAEIALVDGGERVTSDERGVFALPVLAQRPQRVRIDATNYAPLVCRLYPRETSVLVLRDALPWSAPLEVPPIETAGRLAGEGFLKDEKGRSAADATVAVAETGARVTTDEHGRYRIALPDGRATLVAWDRRGRVGRLAPVKSARKQGLVPLPDLVLAPGLALRGYLADGEGKPTAGATLTLRGHGIQRQETTDGSGAFAFDGLFDGVYDLEALPHRGSLGFRRAFTMASADLDLDLALTPARPLEVTVVADARPLPDVWVVAEEGELRESHGRTDAEGKTRLSGLGDGPFEFEVREPASYGSLEVVDYDPQAFELTVRNP